MKGDFMPNIELRNKIGSLPTRPSDEGGDNIAIALALYFDRHVDRPEDDLVDTELGWGTWVMEQTNAALDSIVETLFNHERQKTQGNKETREMPC
jgi:hypothetical protein